MNLFIDECLSDELTDMAIARGHWGSTSTKRRGLLGTKDWDLMPVLIAGDFTLVTKNAVDFRGAKADPGSKGLFKNQPLHAGLVCLNGPVGMDLAMQKELFEAALNKLEAIDGDLVNKALEISLEPDADELIVRTYGLPRS